MKKYFKLLLVLLLGVFFIPMVHAAELPKTGVVYFMEYPNGRLEATENYNEAVNPEEVKLYSDETNSSGEILLCGWSHEGEIRLEQHVPAGYTTNQREITVDLSDTNQVSFINYRGTNPSTGRTFLFLAVIASVVAITFAARRNKKLLMMIPVIVALAIAANINKVSAAEECVSVKVKDGNGTALRNVVVDVYAKPKAVTANPGIKFDANGGKFFDGTTVMYMPIPSDGCSSDDFFNSLDSDTYDYFEQNVFYGAYRNGYYPDGFDMPAELHNGDVYYMEWYQDSYAHVYTIDGNGGTYDFYGKQLNEIHVYDFDDIYDIAPWFNRGGYYYIGFDTDAACSNYTSQGVIRDTNTAVNWMSRFTVEDPEKRIDTELVGEEVSDAARIYKVYDCWHNQPDGIYVNGTLFSGNPETCFFDSETFRVSPDAPLRAFYTKRHDKAMMFQYDDEVHQMIFSPMIIIPTSILGSIDNEPKKESYDKAQSIVTESIDGLIVGKEALPFDVEDIDTLEIIYNGRSILYITKDEIASNEDDVLHLTNSVKEQILYEYFDSFDIEACTTLYNIYDQGIPTTTHYQ